MTQTQFQSTRPSRGETLVGELQNLSRVFQSTRPSRGETQEQRLLQDIRHISIHPPLAGRDRIDSVGVPSALISIHPPLAGRDTDYTADCTITKDFNPPAPRGARRVPASLKLLGAVFQSTRPSRGETKERRQPLGYRTISIHPPLAGRDLSSGCSCPGVNIFQSTRPSRGETPAGI